MALLEKWRDMAYSEQPIKEIYKNFGELILKKKKYISTIINNT